MVSIMESQNLSTVLSSTATSLDEFLNRDPLMNEEDEKKCKQAADSLRLISRVLERRLWSPKNEELAENFLESLLPGSGVNSCELRIWFDIKNYSLSQDLSPETLTGAADLLEEILKADNDSRRKLRNRKLKEIRKLFEFLSKLESHFESPVHCQEMEDYLQAVWNPNE